MNAEKQQRTNLSSKHNVIRRLRRGRPQRSKFVESHVSKTLAFQIRALRDREGWSQQRLAEKIDSNQNAVYRAENPNYGKQTITTLKKIAAAFDVALVVRFVPFSELVDWVSGTPHVSEGLNSDALDVLGFEIEDKAGKFDDLSVLKPAKEPMVTAITSDSSYNSLRGIFEAQPEIAAAYGHVMDAAIQAVQDLTAANSYHVGALLGLASFGSSAQQSLTPSLTEQYEDYMKWFAQENFRGLAKKQVIEFPMEEAA